LVKVQTRQTMAESKFVYNARFVGRKLVDGPLNDIRLTEVVAGFKTNELANKKGVEHHDEVRCNVGFSDKSLLITFIKKDEGFESDTESAKSVENAEAIVADDPDKSDVSVVEEKIIKDHVFRFNEVGGEDSYSSNSSGGSDSETSDHNKSSVSAASSASTSPTAELNKYKFDHLDTYNISDVLICHTDKVYKNCVIWVIRKTGTLEALVFECISEDNAWQLYRKFHEISKRSKLERHRRRKSDGGSILTRGSEPLQIAGNKQIKSDLSVGRGNVTINNNNIDTSVIENVEKNQSEGSGVPQKWNLVQHTDKNGVTHIEVEANTEQKYRLSHHLVNTPPSLRHHGIDTKPFLDDSENQPRSLVSFSPASQGKFSAKGGIGWGKQGDKSKFAKELESILSTELKRRDDMHTGSPRIQRTPDPDDDNSGGQTGYRGQATRSKPPGESLSLRQRAPAMLLRKLDEFEEKAHKIWAKAEADEENRKIWNKTSNSVIGISSLPKGPQLDPPLQEKERIKQKPQKERRDDKDKILVQTVEKGKNNNTDNSKNNKQKDATDGGKKEGDNSRILIPTKTGKEPPKKLYPKDTAPAPMYAGNGRFLPLGVGLPGSQPHSLPMYSGLQIQQMQMQQMQAAGVAWARYPQEMSQLDLSQPVWKFPTQPGPGSDWRHSGPSSESGQRGRSRSRDRGAGRMVVGDNDRRRAQSKSPARRQQQDRGSKYMDGVNLAPDISGLSRMFRDFGGAMKARMGRKGDQKAPSCSMSDLPDAAQLKSNLKKQSGPRNSPSTPDNRMTSSTVGVQGATNANNSSDNKKVHFNKFATVQMMG